MIGKTIITGLFFGLWCFLCQQWYVCGIKRACGHHQHQAPIGSTSEKDTAPLLAPESDPQAYPLTFRWNQPEGELIPAIFVDLQDSLLRHQPEGHDLTVTGFAFDREVPDAATLARQRAAFAAKFFEGTLPATHIKTRSAVLKTISGVEQAPFEAVQWEWTVRPEARARAAIDQNEQLQPISGGMRLYVNPDPVRGDLTIATEAWLDQLAKQLVESGAKVDITGHTDNSRTARESYEHGRERAKLIRNILRDKGVPRSQINVFSRGAQEPLTTNDTPEGRAKNERIEVRYEL